MTTKIAARSERIFRCPASATSPLAPSRVASNQSDSAVRSAPMFISADQAYFWSNEWQRGEAETRANLKAGNAKTFDNPLDAIRHLLSDDC
jgi:hypothetical protein